MLRRRVSGVVALVAVLLAVAPLASALDGGGGPASVSIRVNRGFAASVAKVRLTPLLHDVTAYLRSVVAGDEQRLSRIAARSATLDESSLDSPAERSSETRRGPPNARLA